MKRPTWILKWDDSMSVGIPAFDEDQKHIFSLINAFNRSIAEGMNPDEIQKRLQLLIDDATQHCNREETMIREIGYPDAAIHALAHVHLMAELKKIQMMFVPYGQDSGWVDAGQKIKDMLINHCMVEDMKFVSYYKSQAENANADV